MWRNRKQFHSPGDSYRQVSRSDDNRPSAETSITDDIIEESFHDDLSLTLEELAYQDPLDEKNGLMISKRCNTSKSRWAQLCKWRKSQTPMLAPGVGKSDDGNAAVLLQSFPRASRWARAKHQIMGWLIVLLPSYTHRYFTNGAAVLKEARRSTDYLDGLRGVASLFVFFGHYLGQIAKHMIDYGYGSSHGERGEWNIIQLPFIRTFFSGAAMVSIFFVISGYVLSQRFIIAMRGLNYDQLLVTLTSISFRRGIRLFLPSIIAYLLTLAAVIFGLHEPENPKDWTLFAEISNFWKHLWKDLFKLWDWENTGGDFYSPQLWTIPVEYRCSMVLFLFVLITARCTFYVRFMVEVLMTVYLFSVDRWDVALFISGMIIAELNIVVEERQKTLQSTSTQSNPESCTKSWWRNDLFSMVMWCILFFGYYLTGYPKHMAKQTPGYDWAASIIDNFRFWLGFASILIVGSISFLQRAQMLFTTPIARYLGKISYSLYLVHVLMIQTVMPSVWHVVRSLFNYHKGDGDAKFWVCWLIVVLFTWPIIFWAADIFWRAVDIPTVKLAKWVEEGCFVTGRLRNDI